MSRHLRVLERARLVERRVNAQWRVCRLRPRSLRAAADWLDDYRRFWEESLDRQWMGPRGFKLTVLEMDPRAGGHYHLTMQHRMGDTASIKGTYKEVTPPERIVFTWGPEGEQMAAIPETLVTVTFTERKGEEGVETEVRLLHSGFPTTDARDAHNNGWQGCLNKFVDFTDARGTAASLTVVGDARSTYVRTVRMALVE